MSTPKELHNLRQTAVRHAAALRTVSSATPDAIRRQCLDALVASTNAHFAMFYRTGEVSSGVAIRDVKVLKGTCTEGWARGLQARLVSPATMQAWGESVRATWRSLSDKLAFATTVNRWDGRFVEDAQMATEEQWSRVPNVVFAREKAGCETQLRMTAHAGRVFTGWIGLFRRVGDARFSAAERRVLEPLQAPLKAALAMAARMEDSGAICPPGDLVVAANGRVLFASAQIAPWVDVPWIREAVQQCVRAWDSRSGNVPWDWCAAGLRFRGLRLDGHQVVYVLHAEPIRPILAPATALLTPRQNAVVNAVVAGHSAAAAATTLGMSVHTVRTHLKAAHATLGVTTRAELAQLVTTAVRAGQG